MELCPGQSQDDLAGKGFRTRQTHKGRNGKGEITGRKDTGTSILYLQAAPPQLKHRLLILPTTGEHEAVPCRSPPAPPLHQVGSPDVGQALRPHQLARRQPGDQH